MIAQMFKDWMSLERSQWKSRESLLEEQNRRLTEIVNHAHQNVPFYQRLYDSAHLNVTDVASQGKITCLPTVTRQHLRDTPLQERTAVNTDVSKCVPYSTSGSTGTSVTFLEDHRFAAYQEIAHLRFMLAAGIRPWHKICTVWGTRANLPPLSNKLGLWNELESKVHRRIWGNEINDHMKLYSVWKPDVLIAVPSYFRALLWFTEQNKVNLSFKFALSSGELLDEITRKRFRDTFQADVADCYGLTEVGIVSWECPAHCGYHINVESVFVEFLNDGAPVRPGQTGRVYVTSFDRKATPIIRYFTGDIATLSDVECPCGRGLPLMKNIQGRIVDFIVTEDDRYLSPWAVLRTLRDVRGIENLKVTQRSDRSIDLQFRTANHQVAEVLQILQERCTELFGKMPVNIELVDRIQGEDEPKFRPVESHLTRSQPVCQ